MLLEAAFGGRLPPLVETLLTPQHDPAAFDAGVLLCSSGRHRVYLADRPDPTAWTQAVRGAAPGVERLLSAAPAGVRRMVDTDGETHEVYLDDLQVPRPDLGLMAIVWSSASRALSRVQFVEHLPRGFGEQEALAGDRLAVRTGDGRPHLLWVSEAAHTGDCAGSWARAEAATPLPALALHLRDTVPGLYIDALDLTEGGPVAVTLGLAAG